MSKKVLISGGAGFIGSHLVDSLIEENHDVTVLDILKEEVLGLRFILLSEKIYHS